jgi:hypothetical protein
MVQLEISARQKQAVGELAEWRELSAGQRLVRLCAGRGRCRPC